MYKDISIFDRNIRIYDENSAINFVSELMNSSGTKIIIKLNENLFQNLTDASEVDRTLGKADLIMYSNEDIGNVEDENESFYNVFFRTMENLSVVIIGSENENVNKLETYIKDKYNLINIKGTKIVDTYSEVESTINFINDCVPTVVLSILKSPLQEKMLCDNKLFMNTKIAIGLGNELNFIDEPRRKLLKIFKHKSKLMLQIENYEIKG